MLSLKRNKKIPEFLDVAPSKLCEVILKQEQLKSIGLGFMSPYAFKEFGVNIVNSRTGELHFAKTAPEYFTTSVKDMTIANRKKIFHIDETGSFLTGRTGIYTCAANGNDSAHHNMRALASHLSSHYVPTSIFIALTPMTGKKANNVTFYCNPNQHDKKLEKGKLKPQERVKLLRLVNLCARIPWILLDPSQEAAQYAAKVKPALKIHIKTKEETGEDGIYFGFQFPSTVMITPFIHWWVSVMIREAVGMWTSSSGTIQSKLMEAVKGINLTKIINTHDWSKAKETWIKIRPILDNCYPVGSGSNAWSAAYASTTNTQKLLSPIILLEALATVGGITALQIPAGHRNTASLQEFYTNLAVSAWSLKLDPSKIKGHSETIWGLHNWLIRTHTPPKLSASTEDGNQVGIRVPKTAMTQSDPVKLQPFAELTAEQALGRNQNNVQR